MQEEEATTGRWLESSMFGMDMQLLALPGALPKSPVREL